MRALRIHAAAVDEAVEAAGWYWRQVWPRKRLREAFVRIQFR